MEINNLELEDLETMAKDRAESEAPATVGTLEEPTAREPEAITAEEWTEGGYYAVTITADPGQAEKAKEATATNYEEYLALRNEVHEHGYYIVSEQFLTPAQFFPGFLSLDAAIDVFESANDQYLELKSFPQFSKTAKIRVHDSAVLAADTGGGKSSLAINFIEDLNGRYPCLYFNLEMDQLTVLRRLVSIHSGMRIDQIEGYKRDRKTAEAVNAALLEITTRKPLQVINGVYDLEQIKNIILYSVQFRGPEEPTIVFIDHSLLIQAAGKANNRYERFTAISEELRKLSKDNNIILFILLQQSREGKKDETERPKNWSLKESGSWENDSTHIVFLWWDPEANRKKLILTKNRNGEAGEFALEYVAVTQKYREEQTQGKTQQRGSGPASATGRKKTPREKKKEKLQQAVDMAFLKASTNGAKATLHDIATEYGATVQTVKGLLKEFGGYEINGVHYDPAGIDDVVEGEGFTKPTQAEENEAMALFGGGD